MSVYRQGRAAVNTCPRCMETLVAVETMPGIRHCEKCGGIFADLAASNRIVETLDRQLLAIAFDASNGKRIPRDDGRVLTCPECQLQMVKNRIESAACDIDACPLHGTWFDTNEMVDVMRALDRARKKGVLMTRARPSTMPDLDTTPDQPPGFYEEVSLWFNGTKKAFR